MERQQHSLARWIVHPLDRSSYSRRAKGKSTSSSDFFISVLEGRLNFSALINL
jgi:hypothetical protein